MPGNDLTRRTMLVSGLAVLAFQTPARATTFGPEAARAHVDATIDEILALIVASLPRGETAVRLNRILREKAALPQLARFAAGRHWRTMAAGQQERFVAAFGRYVSRVYAGYFRSFEGSVEDLRKYVLLGKAHDAGSKGIMIESEIRPLDALAISVNWLVSDRSGQIAISDLVVEGISLAVTQREIVGALVEKHRGDIDAAIAELDGIGIGD